MGVRGIGPTKEAAFEEVALAMTAVVTDPERVLPREAVHLECDAPDDELLLADWLNCVIGAMSIRKMLFSRFEVRLDGRHLAGTAWGEPIDRARHHPTVEIKGATYTCLKVAFENGEWIAQTVVDV